MRILIAEDEPKTAAFLRKGLTENGFVVDVAERGDLALDLALTENYDLLILDVLLPGASGWQVLSDLRSAGHSTPALFLTARDTVEERVRGLDLGADDYLVKPFAFSELLARIRSIMRRGTDRTGEILRVADLEIDTVKKKVTRGGKLISLTPKEFTLLELLVRRSGEVLSRSLIIEKVWDMNFEGDTKVVDVSVHRLRAKIDEHSLEKLIHSVRGFGYVLGKR